jgi:hypothetical protein
MNQQQLIRFAEEFFGKSIDLMKRKNADYANPETHKDAFGNLKAVETFNISTGVGFITRMTDKLSRISTFVHAGQLQVKDESVTDTLRDLANYSMLMAAWIESEKAIPESQNT